MPGLGGVFTYHPLPELALEGALGLSLSGWKTGIRARWNILSSEWTPTVGLGFMYATGTLGSETETEIDGEKVRFSVLRSPFAQLVAGVNYVGEGGLFFSALAGYAPLLRKRNFKLHAGEPDPEQLDVLKSIVGGGVVISLALGGAL